MTTLQTLTIVISFGLLSCNNNRSETKTIKNESVKIDSVSIDTAMKSEQQWAVGVTDTITRFVVDDYPVTNTMLADNTSNISSYQRQSGKTFSYDKSWFSNDTIKQTLVFELLGYLLLATKLYLCGHGLSKDTNGV